MLSTMKYLIFSSLIVFIFMSPNCFAATINSNNATVPLTLEEYQQCLERTERFNQQSKQLQDEREQIDAMERQIETARQQRDDFRQKLDLHNSQSVNQYNRLNGELNDQLSEFELRVKAFNQAVKDSRQQAELLKQECEGRPYLQK